MLQEYRAVRSVIRRPAPAATIVLTLALGIGANSAIFSAVDAVLLKPLPYPAPERLVSVYEADRAHGDGLLSRSGSKTGIERTGRSNRSPAMCAKAAS